MMGRRWLIPQLSLGAALVLCAVAVAQEQAPPQLQVTAVAPNIHLLAEAGGNICLFIGDDGALLIDGGVTPQAPNVLAAVKEKTDKPLRFVINTHWHFDHTGGNQALAEAGAQIIAHENVYKRMSSEQVLGGFERRMPPAPPAALPKMTYAKEMTVHWNSEVVRISHIEPAHSDGDSVVLFERAHVLHTGDVFFNGVYPYIDANAGGSIDGMIAAVDRVLEMARPDTKIIPGHGPLATPDDLRAYHQMLTTVRERVQSLVRAGKTRDEVLAAKPTSDLDEKWGRGGIEPDLFVGAVYAGMTSPRPSGPGR